MFEEDQNLGNKTNDFLQNFGTWADKACPDANLILGSLLKGIQDAGMLKKGSWKQEGNILEAWLVSDPLYGETASASRLPMMWKLDGHLKFTFTVNSNKCVVATEGMRISSSAQSMELYKAAMKAKGIDGSTCDGEAKCLQEEVDAAGVYLKKNWKKMKKSMGKITEILKTSYDKTVIYLALKAAGEWPGFFYAMICGGPGIITSIVFEDGKVYADSGPDVDSPIYPEAAKYHFYEKAELQMMKSLLTSKSTLATAEKAARSGINFAKFVGYVKTSTEEREKMGDVIKADPAAIANLFTFCKGSTPGKDPACKGKTPGRVAWSSEIPKLMA